MKSLYTFPQCVKILLLSYTATNDNQMFQCLKLQQATGNSLPLYMTASCSESEKSSFIFMQFYFTFFNSTAI